MPEGNQAESRIATWDRLAIIIEETPTDREQSYPPADTAADMYMEVQHKEQRFSAGCRNRRKGRCRMRCVRTVIRRIT